MASWPRGGCGGPCSIRGDTADLLSSEREGSSSLVSRNLQLHRVRTCTEHGARITRSVVGLPGRSCVVIRACTSDSYVTLSNPGSRPSRRNTDRVEEPLTTTFRRKGLELPTVVFSIGRPQGRVESKADVPAGTALLAQSSSAPLVQSSSAPLVRQARLKGIFYVRWGLHRSHRFRCRLTASYDTNSKAMTL